MPLPKSKVTSTEALVGLWTLALATFIIAALYFGRELLTPIALASLLTFLLAPLVTRLQRWLGRVGAVLLVVIMLFVGTVFAGWVLTRQIVDLGTQLPNYKENIRTKLQAFQLPSGGAFSKLSETFNDLKKDIPGANGVISQEASKGVSQLKPDAGADAVAVRVVSTPDKSPIELFRLIVAPIVGPLGTSALVLLLLIFMLLKREDLSARIIRLIGQGRISATTSAMDDAAERVTRYLLMQLIVNVTYGIPVAIGLYFIGVPNAILWGTFATVLRFIPYVGPWIAAAFPVVLSLAVSPDWTMPALTIGLFIVLELVSNNVMEPWLYGSSTGVSSLALIIAAVFWTYLWGPVGLVMATPITVCMAVMGRHIPRLAFLNVLLSDEEALTPAEDCYHRLLRSGGQDELELTETFLKQHTLTDFYDTMLIPALIAGGNDHKQGLLDKDQIDQLEFAVQELLEEMDDRLPAMAKFDENEKKSQDSAVAPSSHIFCVPARAERDRLAGEMLAQLLRYRGHEATSSSEKTINTERLNLIGDSKADVVCISATEPTPSSHARYFCVKVREAFPSVKILVGLWGIETISPETDKALREAGADAVVRNISEAELMIHKLTDPIINATKPAEIPENEEQRMESFQALGMLRSGEDLKPFTEKLTRIFKTPIALLSLLDSDLQHFKAQTGLPDKLAQAGSSPRATSICGHVVADDQMIVIEDLARDRRFSNNPLVKENGFRFYAGAPVRSPDGQAIGVLCLIDTEPREFTERERQLLSEYAQEVGDDLLRAAPDEVTNGIS